MMKKSKLLKNAVNLVKGVPLNIDERMEELEKNVNLKFAQLEDTMATLNQIIVNLSEENKMLKEGGLSLKQSLTEKVGFSNSLLDGIKERIIKPMREEADEFVELIFNEAKEEPELSNPPGPKIAMKNNTTSAKRELNTITERGGINLNGLQSNKDILQSPLQSPFPADIEQPELKPELDVGEASNKRDNTIKWMRQKFGLSANIRERKLKAVKSKRFKR